jgi:hypothetical protein
LGFECKASGNQGTWPRLPYIWHKGTNGLVRIPIWPKNKFIYEQLRKKQSNSCLEVCS